MALPMLRLTVKVPLNQSANSEMVDEDAYGIVMNAIQTGWVPMSRVRQVAKNCEYPIF